MINTNKKILIPIILIIMILSTINVFAQLDYSESYYSGYSFNVPYNPSGQYTKAFYIPSEQYIIFSGQDDVRIYNINDLSTLNISSLYTYSFPYTIRYISNDGLTAYTLNIAGDLIYKFELSEAYNFSTATNTQNYSIELGLTKDIYFNDDESELYTLCSNSVPFCDEIRIFEFPSDLENYTKYTNLSLGGSGLNFKTYDGNSIFIGSDSSNNIYLDIFTYNVADNFNMSNLETSYFLDIKTLANGVLGYSSSIKEPIPINDDYFLFMSRNSTSPEQRLYLFNTNSTPFPPTKITDVLGLSLAFNSILDINMNDYFSNYDYVNISIYDDIQSTLVNLSVNKGDTNNVSYDTANITLELIPLSDDITFRIYSKTTNLTFNGNLTAYNINGNATIRNEIYIENIFVPVVQTAEFKPIYLGENSTTNLAMSNYFNFYSNITLEFYDSCTDTNISLEQVKNGITKEYENTCLKLKMTSNPTNIQLYITSKIYNYTASINVKASNNYGFIYNSNPLLININSSFVPDTTSEETTEEGGVVSDFLSGLFPDSDTLNNGEKLLRVIATIFLTIIALVILGMEGGGLRILSFIGSAVVILEIFYFAFIGYIPVIALIILGLIGGGIVYILLKGKGGG